MVCSGRCAAAELIDAVARPYAAVEEAPWSVFGTRVSANAEVLKAGDAALRVLAVIVSWQRQYLMPALILSRRRISCECHPPVSRLLLSF